MDALERGEIAISRYESYLSLLADCEEEKYR
jgi:putative ribosome biogenesis GTPase RsgA